MKGSACLGAQGRPDDERYRGHRWCESAAGSVTLQEGIAGSAVRYVEKSTEGRHLTSRANRGGWGVLLNSGGARVWRGEQINAAMLRRRTGAQSSGKPEWPMSCFEQMRLEVGLPASARRNRGRVGNRRIGRRSDRTRCRLPRDGGTSRCRERWTYGLFRRAWAPKLTGRLGGPRPAVAMVMGSSPAPAWPLQPATT